ncbi:MAG TPA: hypothetical protein VE987_17400 [Polyangiaceae bacterium]|nr:hypothetical protein [Polyangiaceae bacterium]
MDAAADPAPLIQPADVWVTSQAPAEELDGRATGLELGVGAFLMAGGGAGGCGGLPARAATSASAWPR